MRRTSPDFRIEPWCLRGWLSSDIRRCAFVSHCGTSSVYESLAVGMPIVGIPMFVDQGLGGPRGQRGHLVWLDKTRFDPEDLNKAIVRVLSDPSFARSMPRLRRAFAHEGSVRRAADIIELEPGRRR
ncbi:MAG TPA: hypothetical protein VIW73_07085 [Candidatus Cybelea sp.]